MTEEERDLNFLTHSCCGDPNICSLCKATHEITYLTERVKELEHNLDTTSKMWKGENESASRKMGEIEFLKWKNTHYQKALEFYADKSNHREARGDGYESEVFMDGGERATKALKGELN